MKWGAQEAVHSLVMESLQVCVCCVWVWVTRVGCKQAGFCLHAVERWVRPFNVVWGAHTNRTCEHTFAIKQAFCVFTIGNFPQWLLQPIVCFQFFFYVISDQDLCSPLCLSIQQSFARWPTSQMPLRLAWLRLSAMVIRHYTQAVSCLRFHILCSLSCEHGPVLTEPFGHNQWECVDK